MKILQVNSVYGEKSTGKLTRELHFGIRKAGHESVVVYGRGGKTSDPGVIRLCPDWYGKFNSLLTRFTGIRNGGCLLSTLRLMHIISREKPDIVHLQCINGNFVNIFRLIAWLKNKRIKTVVGLHAEFMYTANCGHAFDCNQWISGCKKCPSLRAATKSIYFDRTKSCWRHMHEAFRGFSDCVAVAVSPWTAQRAAMAEILRDIPIRTVCNGIDTDVFSPSQELPEKNTVLHVTACFSAKPEHPKGGWYLIRLAEMLPDVRFVVVGPDEVNTELPKNIELTGEIRSPQRLAELYRQAAVSVIVSQRETYSLPCAESLCCGTPVVGFCAGAPELISLPEWSEFVPFGDVERLAEALLARLSGRETDRNRLAKEARQTYSSDKMIHEYFDVYGSLLWN
ncbi:MAG: glycosyltransferase [Clostridia bacterium]|nr:glycosyltransferase [Clostridia bacterium]